MPRQTTLLGLLGLLTMLACAGCGSSQRAPLTPPPQDPDRPPPVASDIEQLSLGQAGSCAALTSGRAHCWGEWHGALIKPWLPAIELEEIKEIRIGSDALVGVRDPDHLCVRDAHAELRCWGNARYGQLGASISEAANAPVEIASLPPITQLALGAQHSCALTAEGEVLCWGSNEYGQLGIGKSQKLISQPTRVELPAKATQLSTGQFTTCALTEPRQVFCWGENLRGEAGAPPPSPTGGLRAAWTPTLVTAATGAVQLSAASSAHCATKLDGKIACWGYLTDKLGPAFAYATQGEVPALDDAISVAVGHAHACAIRRDGSVWCWGTGADGALGDGKSEDSWQPMPVSLPGRATQLVAAKGQSCARLDDRRWYCWGDNRNGAIAARDVPALLTPAPLDLSALQ